MVALLVLSDSLSQKCVALQQSPDGRLGLFHRTLAGSRQMVEKHRFLPCAIEEGVSRTFRDTPFVAARNRPPPLIDSITYC